MYLFEVSPESFACNKHSCCYHIMQMISHLNVFFRHIWSFQITKLSFPKAKTPLNGINDEKIISIPKLIKLALKLKTIRVINFKFSVILVQCSYRKTIIRLYTQTDIVHAFCHIHILFSAWWIKYPIKSRLQHHYSFHCMSYVAQLFQIFSDGERSE